MTVHVLVVDDSALIRKVLSDILNTDPEIKVVGTAVNGEDGLEKVEKLRPDVILLDNVMPVLDGLKTLARIMKRHPTPVIMVSVLGEKAEQITLTAFEYGAVDVIQKPEGILSQTIPEIADEICRKVRAAAKANLKNLECMQEKEDKKLEIPQNQTRKKIYIDSIERKDWFLKKINPAPVGNVLAIGASTGGPRALEKLISSFPSDLPAAILVVQHMPPGFTASFAKRLDAKSPLRVKEANEGDLVEEGTVLIAPGN